MKTKSIFSLLMAFVMVTISLFQPLSHQYVKAAPADSNRLTYKFDGFSNEILQKSFSVNGVAGVPEGADFLRLTPAAIAQSGGVFNITPLSLRNNYSFSTVFSFRISEPDNPGDGLTLTIQADTAGALTQGGGIGYQGIEPSFTIKYDTYRNTGYMDPSANYVGLARDGSVINDRADWYIDLDQYNTANGTDFVLHNGTMYYTWIDYDGLAQNVQVRLGTTPEREEASLILDVGDIDLGEIFEGKMVYAGFTSATGSAYENHDIHSWYFRNDYEPITTLQPPNDYVENQLPTAPDYNALTRVDTPVSGQVVGSDPDGDDLTYQAGKQPSNGTIVVNEDGTWTYTPNEGFLGEDTFTVIVDDGYGGTIESTITVQVVPVPPDACTAPVALINGSFEEPAFAESGISPAMGWFNVPQARVPGWQTTDSSGILEIFNQSLMDQIPPGSPGDQGGLKNDVIHGQQFAELNSREAAQLYQDVTTTPGQTIYWRLAHKGRLGDDTMAVKIGSADIAPGDLPTVATFTTGKDEWKYYSGEYTVPADQTVTRFGFEAVESAGGNPAAGNFLDDIFLGTEPCVVAEKSVSPNGAVFEGDVLTYQVKIKNEGGDIAADTVFEDAIPEETEYISGSMKIVDGPNAGALTDEDDDDAGYFDGDKVIITLGDLPNATDLPDGITVEFQVRALASYAGESAANQAVVHYKNLLKDEQKTAQSNEVSNLITERPEIPNACSLPVSLINGSFEQGPAQGSYTAPTIN
ncbi:lectin-like domain-containing protein [Paenibacillus senegalensis]|uniref:lectin-like domain-containing protein n=1 Tax=Paenibacillus senegalensis TaxID=1465766 RepID=UPI000289E336|nr:Ig-like domain-containing protein [Paenibacillus senegalensis]